MAISFPRTFLSSLSLRHLRSFPRHRTRPSVILSDREIRLSSASEKTVLPQPDSPTNPQISPGPIAKSTPSTAVRKLPLRSRNWTLTPSAARRGWGGNDEGDESLTLGLAPKAPYSKPLGSHKSHAWDSLCVQARGASSPLESLLGEPTLVMPPSNVAIAVFDTIAPVCFRSSAQESRPTAGSTGSARPGR
jgi:hypothetical protein